jgi:aryl-alcohol dehydrogenase-like predicted oxidoreductase
MLKKPWHWPKDGRVPTAAMAYRFALSCPDVHVCLNAPSNEAHLAENLTALRDGPLDDDDMHFMKQFGDTVHGGRK